jgi:hypothetical protein
MANYLLVAGGLRLEEDTSTSNGISCNHRTLLMIPFLQSSREP